MYYWVFFRKGENAHPGRQAVSLLILMNLSLWLVDTFELQVSFNRTFKFIMSRRMTLSVTICHPVTYIFPLLKVKK